MKPEPAFDDVLMHLVDINVCIGLANAACIGAFLVFLWMDRCHKKLQNSKSLHEELDISEETDLVTRFPDTLLTLAQTPIYTRNDVFNILTEMMLVSQDFINVSLFRVMNTDQHVDIGLALVNKVWNDVWDQLPSDRRFFIRDAFLLFYTQEKATRADGETL